MINVRSLTNETEHSPKMCLRATECNSANTSTFFEKPFYLLGVKSKFLTNMLCNIMNFLKLKVVIFSSVHDLWICFTMNKMMSIDFNTKYT